MCWRGGGGVLVFQLDGTNMWIGHFIIGDSPSYAGYKTGAGLKKATDYRGHPQLQQCSKCISY